MALPNPPNITQGQIALDPINGIVYYKDDNNNLVSTTWSWLQDNETQISTEDEVTISSNLTVGGDLIISGDTVSLNVAQVLIEDNILVLNSNVTGSPILSAGLEVERGTSANVQIRWNEALDKWQFTNDGTTYLDLNSIVANSVTLGFHTVGDYVANLTAGTGVSISQISGEGATPTISIGQDVATSATPTFARVVAPLTGNVTGNVTGNLTGNVNGNITGNLTGNVTGNVTGTVSDISNHGINALSDVTITSSADGDFLRWTGSAWVNDAVNLTSDTVGDYVKSLVQGNGLTISNNSGEGATPNIAIDTSIVQTRVTNITDTEIGYLDGVTSGVQAQINTKAPTADPTFTGTVSGVSKSMVGLGNVDNTSDANKPVSTAQQTALDLKANSATPNFTGMATIPKITVGGIEIDTTSPADTNVLKYNASLNKYIPGVATVVATLDDLTDVSAATPVLYQPLIWDGNNWQVGPFNQFLRLGESGVSDVTELNYADVRFDPIDGRHAEFGLTKLEMNDLTTTVQLDYTSIRWVDNATGNGAAIEPLGATNGQVLAFNTGSLSFVPSDISVDSLSDVSAATPSNDEVLAWQSSTSQWISKTFSAVVNAIDAIGDVTAASPSSGDYLKWSGSAWINDSVDLGTDTNGNYISGVTEGTGVTITHTPGEGSTPTFAIGQSVATSAVPTFAGLNLTQNGVLIFEGATDDNFETTLSVIDPTADRTISLPNISGTVITTGDTETVTSTMIANGTIVNDDVNASAAIVYSKLSLNNSVDYTDLKDGPAKAGFRSVLNDQTGATYTLALTDLAKLVTLSNAGAITLTVPLNSSVAFAIGDRIDLLQKGAGQVTIVGTGGVTVNGTPGLKLRAQWSSATLIKLDTNSWVLLGDLQA